MREYKNLMVILAVIGVTTSVNSERGNNNDDNYIITHYGTERYTPVKETNYQFHNDGYYKSEIIPVDLKTGEEIKSTNYNGQPDSILIPMHVGYSVSVNNNDYPDAKNEYQVPSSDPATDENKPKRYTLPKYKKRTPTLNNTHIATHKKQTKFIPKNKTNNKLIQDEIYNNYSNDNNNNYNKRSNLPNKQISRRNKLKNQADAANEGIETYYEKKVKKRTKYFR